MSAGESFVDVNFGNAAYRGNVYVNESPELVLYFEDHLGSKQSWEMRYSPKSIAELFPPHLREIPLALVADAIRISLVNGAKEKLYVYRFVDQKVKDVRGTLPRSSCGA